MTALATTPQDAAGSSRVAGAHWVEQDGGPRRRIAQECEYARATVAALLSGMPVRRRGDLLHVRVDGRWHAMAMVPAAGPGSRRATSEPESCWVHFDLDRHDWFTFGSSGYRTVPAHSGWDAMRWLAGTHGS